MKTAIAFMLAALLGLALLFTYGCGTTNLQRINAANEAAKQLRIASAPVFDSRCLARALACKGRAPALEQCKPWVACRDARRVFVATIGGIHLSASSAATAAILSKQPKLGNILAAVLEQLAKAHKLAKSAGAL